MKTVLRILAPSAALVAALGCVPAVMAQSHTQTAASVASGGAATPQAQYAGSVEYVSGGVGEESRAALQTVQADYPLRLVFSVKSGEYLVADTLQISKAGGETASMNSVGPIVMLKLAPGDYTVTADYSGRSEQKKIKVGSGAQTINWRW